MIGEEQIWDKQRSKTYRCEHFAIDVYRHFTGKDLSGYFLTGGFAQPKNRRHFVKLDAPSELCFALCRRKNEAHIGIWHNNAVLHLGDFGALLQPLAVLRVYFSRVDFYAIKD